MPDRKPPLRAPTRAARAHAQRVGARVNESAPPVIEQIARAIMVLGAPTIDALVDEARTVYAGPGMRTKNDQPRTLGGIFFVLMRERATQRQWRQILPHRLYLEQVGRAPKRGMRRGGAHRRGGGDGPRPNGFPARTSTDRSRQDRFPRRDGTSHAQPQPITLAALERAGAAAPRRLHQPHMRIIGQPSWIKDVAAASLVALGLTIAVPRTVQLPDARPTRFVVLLQRSLLAALDVPLDAAPFPRVMLGGTPALDERQPGVIVVWGTQCQHAAPAQIDSARLSAHLPAPVVAGTVIAAHAPTRGRPGAPESPAGSTTRYLLAVAPHLRIPRVPTVTIDGWPTLHGAVPGQIVVAVVGVQAASSTA